MIRLPALSIEKNFAGRDRRGGAVFGNWEISRPAGENAGLRDDAAMLGNLDDQVSGFVDGKNFAGRDRRGGAVFGNWEISRPAGENAGLRDDAAMLGNLDDQVSGFVDGKNFAGRDRRGGAVFGNWEVPRPAGESAGLRDDAAMLGNPDDQVSGFVEEENFAGRDRRGGAVFGNDGGAGIFFAGTEFVAREDLCGKFLAGEQDLGFGRGRLAEIRSAWTAGGGRPHMGRGDLRLRGFHGCAEAEGDEFHVSLIVCIAVAAAVFVLEIF